MPFFEQLKNRKIVQWALAYAAGAWAVLQLFDILTSAYSLPPFVMRATPIVLAVGFLIVLVVAWYHGERGMQRVTATELAIVTVLLFIAGLAVAFIAPRPEANAPQEAAADIKNASVAVMPFQNMSSDREQDYFSDGITEEILNALAQVEGLQVAARTSSFAFKGKDVTAEEIGQRLHVAHILEGSVRKSGRHLRITAQLINAKSGFHLWSKNFDYDEEDVLVLQDQIARAVATELSIKLAAPSGLRIRKVVPEAHNEYLLGLALWNDRTERSLTEALQHFQRATEIDPGYALAYAMIANTLVIIPSWSNVKGIEVLPKARAAAQRALQLDPNLPEAHAALGAIEGVYEYRWDAAESSFRRALELNPNYATAQQWLAESLMSRDPQRAVREARTAVVMDPLSRAERLQVGNALLIMHDLDGALQSYRETEILYPTLAPAYAGRIWVFALRKDAAGVRHEVEAARQAGASLSDVYRLVPDALVDPSKRAAFMEALATAPVTEITRARWFIILGDKRKGLESLAKSIAEKSPDVARQMNGPWFDSVRTDTTYLRLYKTLNL